MKIVTPFICLLLSYNSIAQSLNWAYQIGGSNLSSYEQVSEVKCDLLADNIYSAGFYNTSADFDPSAGTYTLSNPGNTAYITKVNSVGNLIWAKHFAGTNSVSYAMDIDASGDIYVAGMFTGTVDFDPGIGTTNLTSAGSTDGFVVKLDPSGNFLWAKSFGGTGIDEIRSIDTKTLGAVLVTGNFTGVGDFNPGAGTFNLTSNGSNEIFVVALNSSGVFDWAQSFGGTGYDRVGDIITSSSTEIYLTGGFLATVDFDNSGAIANLTSAGSTDVFILKLDIVGNFLWVKQLAGTNANQGNALCFTKTGNILVTGSFDGTVDYDSGPSTYNLTSSGGKDIFVTEINTAGNFVQAFKMGGISDETSYTINSDSLKNIYVGGSFNGSANFNTSTGSNILNSAGGEDGFVAKLDSAGILSWVKQIGGTGSDRTLSISTGPNVGDVFIGGMFESTVDFDPATTSFLLSSNAASDGFVQAINCGTVTATTTLLACAPTLVNGQLLSNDGVYYQQLVSADGCDSLLTINFTLNQTSANINVQVCETTYTTPSGNYTYTVNGTYYDTIPNHLGCDSLLTINLTFTPGVIDLGLTVTNGIYTSVQSGAIYQWYDCANNTNISGQTSQTFQPTINGDYAVIVNYGGCSDTSSCILIGDVGIKEMNDSGISIFPNPTSSTIQILSTSNISKIMIMDLSGKEIFESTINGLNKIIDLSSVLPGVYYVKVTLDDNSEIIKKVIKY